MIQDKDLRKQIGRDGRTLSMTTKSIPARLPWADDWQHWTPYAALVWSLIYSALGLYWATGGRGLPYTINSASDNMGPLLWKFGPVGVWIVMVAAGIPAVVIAATMLREVRNRVLRTLLIGFGVLLAGVLLLFMTGLDLLVKVGYLPSAIFGLLKPDMSQAYLNGWTQWSTIHQLLCIIGGFLWLAATVSYARRSGNACLYCGRGDNPEGWTSPDKARRWGRIAVYVAMIAPIFYALVRVVWALGIPLGMSEELFRYMEGRGALIGGLSLAFFCLVGAVLMLGLVQRWGEVFPRWMIGLAGRRVPIALAVVPASLAAVLLFVGGIGIWSTLPQLVANLKAGGAERTTIIAEVIFQVGPTLVFPIWGTALAVATLGYYYRRRGPCEHCGRGI